MSIVPGLGVVGGGVWAQHHMNAVRDLEQDSRARLAGMCARTNETVGRVSKEYGIPGTTDYTELIGRDDVHAVSIVTPDHLHREMAIAAMEAGKHVIVEKPMDLTVAGCEQVIQAARKNKVLLFVDFHKRYDPVHQKAREMILQGKLGQIRYGYAYMEDKIVVPRDMFPKWAASTTPFWFIGVHQVDMLRWSLGSEVVRVIGRASRGKLASMNIDTYDSVHAQLDFDNGAVFSVDISWILPENFEALVNQGARFVGTDGILELDTQDRGFRGCFGPGNTQTYNVNSSHRRELAHDTYQHTGYFVEPVKDFMRLVAFLLNEGSLEGIATDYPTGEDGLEATRIAEAVHRSIAQDVPISVERSERDSQDEYE